MRFLVQRSRSLHPGTRIALAYAVLAALWIALSVLPLVVHDAAVTEVAFFEIGKGLLFVLVTALLLRRVITRYADVLEERNVQLRSVLDSMTDLVLVVNERGRIVRANRAAKELLGIDDEAALLGEAPDVTRRLGLRAVDGKPLRLEDTPLVRVLRAGERASLETMLRHASGRDVYVSVRAAPVLRERTGEVLGGVSVLRDVSEQRRLERMRDEFLAVAAHELKTPVAIVRARAQLLGRQVGASVPPVVHDATEAIMRHSDRLARLIDEMLLASRIQSTGLALQRAPTDLGRLGSEIIGKLHALDGHHSLHVDVEPGLEVAVDRERIELVFLRLVDNAFRYSPQGGEIELRVRRADGRAHVSVRDDGIGIPVEELDAVFDHFHRAQTGTAADRGGLGVGLSLSRAIVERHGGRMWAESEPGHGATIHFEIPLAKGEAHEAAAHPGG